MAGTSAMLAVLVAGCGTGGGAAGPGPGGEASVTGKVDGGGLEGGEAAGDAAGASGDAGAGRDAHASEGGPGGSDGATACGQCGATQCSSAVQLSVTADSPDGGPGIVSSLTAQGPGLSLTCMRSSPTCAFFCQSGPTLADGSYTVTLRAPGYRPLDVPIHAVSPGRCSCCGFSISQSVKLVPDGTPVAGCCADLQTDPQNCGACGRACIAPGASCSAGKCAPAYRGCIDSGSPATSCDAYCASLGQSCTAACGANGFGGTDAVNWWTSPGCPSTAATYSTSGVCSTPFAWSAQGGPQSYRCCCTDN